MFVLFAVCIFARIAAAALTKEGLAAELLSAVEVPVRFCVYIATWMSCSSCSVPVVHCYHSLRHAPWRHHTDPVRMHGHESGCQLNRHLCSVQRMEVAEV